MTISDHSRHSLHKRLDEVLGPDDAATLMEHLPPVGWADVATKRDLDRLGVVLRSELAQLRTEVKGDLSREIGGLRAGFKSDIAGVREEIGGLRADLHKEIGALRADMARQLPTLFLGVLGLQISGAGLVVAASRLL
ncbi:MAG TPA: hypothetical protein VM143_00600 [Acidimicrobiales bacterium]|nr:hypothetical protein [Acidimicrobiales bacterium]